MVSFFTKSLSPSLFFPQLPNPPLHRHFFLSGTPLKSHLNPSGLNSHHKKKNSSTQLSLSLTTAPPCGCGDCATMQDASGGAAQCYHWPYLLRVMWRCLRLGEGRSKVERKQWGECDCIDLWWWRTKSLPTSPLMSALAVDLWRVNQQLIGSPVLSKTDQAKPVHIQVQSFVWLGSVTWSVHLSD